MSILNFILLYVFVGYDKYKSAVKRKQVKLSAVDYKGGVCRICGYDGLRCLSAMEFHHLDPQEKDYNISSKPVSLDKIKEELDKCVLVCCRCHREIHDGQHPQYISLDNREYEYDYDLD